MLERPPKPNENEELTAKQIAFSPEVQKLNIEYPYWDKVKHLKTANNDNSRLLWFGLKLLRKLNRTILHFGEYKFSFMITDEMFELLHYFDMNIGGSLTEEKNLPSENKQAYLISSIMEEAIASSQMEGAATTRKVAKDMLRKNEKPRNQGQQMIQNNYNTINYIKNHAKDPFSVSRLIEIHRSMTEGTLNDKNDEGKIRQNDNVLVMDAITGSIVHIPPSSEELYGLLSDLEKFFNNNEKSFVHPIVKAIIIHFMLSYIHPFVDGNGRTARSLFYWYMMKQDYWLIEYMSISRIIYKAKKSYEKAFLYTEYDENDLTYFIVYHLRVMKKAFEELKQYLKRKTEDNKTIKTLTLIEGINQRQAQIIQLIKEQPDSVFTVKEIENRFSVSNFTARTDLEGLKKLGYMSAIQVNKVKRVYTKSTMFENLLP